MLIKSVSESTDLVIAVKTYIYGNIRTFVRKKEYKIVIQGPTSF